MKKIISISLVSASLLVSNAYAAQIIGAEPADAATYTDWNVKQFAFGGWNLSNVTVLITDTDYAPIPMKTFNSVDGTYSTMVLGDSFESQITTGAEHRGNLHGKDWPVGEPAGIKIINNDTKTSNGKPINCILTTSYLAEENNPAGGNGYLDGTPAPVICSSAFQTHKRFKVNMLPLAVAGVTPGQYGKPIDLVFNLANNEHNATTMRYQIFQKINNYTGARLEGYKVELLDGSGAANPALTFSLGIGEDGGSDIWGTNEMATFSHGLWGAADNHFPTDGYFDSTSAGFVVSGHGTSVVESGATLGSNYNTLWGGFWLPSVWEPTGIFFDHDNDDATDAELMAFWGVDPNFPAADPAWHKGQADNWAHPSLEELVEWSTNAQYFQGPIEDTLNLGLNYIVNVGAMSLIGTEFTLRITPKVAAIQTAPTYIAKPPTDITVGNDAIVVISPAPTFIIGNDVTVAIADTDLNLNVAGIDTVDVNVTTSNGDLETLTLSETENNSSIFTNTITTVDEATTAVSQQDGTLSVASTNTATVTYDDGGTVKTDTTTAIVSAGDPAINPSTGGGGGCTYNPNSKKFDMMFLVLMGLGMFYIGRRRFAR